AASDTSADSMSSDRNSPWTASPRRLPCSYSSRANWSIASSSWVSRRISATRVPNPGGISAITQSGTVWLDPMYPPPRSCGSRDQVARCHPDSARVGAALQLKCASFGGRHMKIMRAASLAVVMALGLLARLGAAGTSCDNLLKLVPDKAAVTLAQV